MQDLVPAVFEIGPDLLFDRSLRDSHANVERPTGEVLFSPRIFRAQDLAGGLSAHRLEQDELISLGHLATEAKERFREERRDDSQNAKDVNSGVVDGSELEVHDLKRSYDRKKAGQSYLLQNKQEFHNDESTARKEFSKSQLSCDQLSSII